MNIAYGFNVSYMRILYRQLNGININWSAGIKTPIIPESNGILKVFEGIGNGLFNTLPYANLAWGIVGDIMG